MVIDLSLKLPEGTTVGGAQSADIRLDFQLLDVNEDQEIEAPENAKPFAELLKQLEGLGAGPSSAPSAAAAARRRRRSRTSTSTPSASRRTWATTTRSASARTS